MDFEVHHFAVTLSWMCLMVIFHLFYRSKSPSNHHLGAYLLLFPSIKRSRLSKFSVENPYKLFRFQVSIKF